MVENVDSVLLVGTGPMAVEYVKVLKALGKEIRVVGRGRDSAEKFKEATGIMPITGGIDEWLKNAKEPCKNVIVSVTENELGNTTLALLKEGFTSILVEKPGGASYAQIEEVAKETKARKAHVWVGYNRRFNASTEKAREMILADGGITSSHFEFTEWSHIIGTLKKAEGVLEFWFMHNSSHVVDLAFFLGGKPEELSSYTAGGVPWHPAASIFSGAGKAENGALFSYQANWQAPGRWSVEILTAKNRYIFKPLEGLLIQAIGSVAVNEVPFDNHLDKEFKPGLYKQVEAFLNRNTADLCTIEEQRNSLAFYRKMCPYE